MSTTEMSRPYFEREMRVGRRVIFQWDEVKRFGQVCPDCPGANAEGKVIEGMTFVDEQRAESFDLDWLQPYDPRSDQETLTLFDTWESAEEWVLRT